MGWPLDLMPGACLSCYEKKGIDRPAEQCTDHPAARRLD